MRMNIVFIKQDLLTRIWRHLGYEKVYLPLHKVADTPFHVWDDDEMFIKKDYCCVARIINCWIVLFIIELQTSQTWWLVRCLLAKLV